MKNFILMLVVTLQTWSITVFAFDSFVCCNDETTIYKNDTTANGLEFVSKDGDGKKARVTIGFITQKVNENIKTKTYFFEVDGEAHALSVSAQRDLWRDEKGKASLFVIDLEAQKLSEEATFTCRVSID